MSKLTFNQKSREISFFDDSTKSYVDFTFSNSSVFWIVNPFKSTLLVEIKKTKNFFGWKINKIGFDAAIRFQFQLHSGSFDSYPGDGHPSFIKGFDFTIGVKNSDSTDRVVARLCDGISDLIKSATGREVSIKPLVDRRGRCGIMFPNDSGSEIIPGETLFIGVKCFFIYD